MEKDKYLVVYISTKAMELDDEDEQFVFMTAEQVKGIYGEHGKDFLLYQQVDISDIR